MTDITTIPACQFYEIKGTVGPPPETVRSRYEKLFASHSCFTQVVQPFLPPKQPKTPVHIAPRITKTTNIKKQMVGILNIINESNYQKMFNKIRMMINSQNIEYIVTELLTKCCLQVFFIHVFLRLLGNIVSVCERSEKDKIYQTVNSYVNSFVENNEYMLPAKPEGAGAYDSFCMVQKHKSIVIAKNIIISELINVSMVSLTLERYSTYLCEKIDTTSCEQEIEMLLQMMTDLKKRVPKCNISFDYERILSITSNQKIRFITEDLLSILHPMT